MAVASFYSTIHGRQVKLGRKPPREGKVILRLGDYLDFSVATVAPPESVDYTAKALAAIAEMYLNDTEGDCVIADRFHSAGIWTGNETGTPLIGSDAEVQAAYTTICGPGDQGCVISDVLDYVKATGITIGGVVHKIDDYVSVDWTNKLEVQVALFLFGTITLGINLPEGWTNSQVWDLVTGAAAKIVGGHDVPAAAYNPTGPIICTWGGTRQMTWPAFQSRTWLEEAYAILSPDWYSSGNVAACGVDVATLRKDLAIVAAGGVPPIPGPPRPGPHHPPRPPVHPHPHPHPRPGEITPEAQQQRHHHHHHHQGEDPCSDS